MARKKTNTQLRNILILVLLLLFVAVGYLLIKTETFTRSSDASTGERIFNPFTTGTEMTQRRNVIATNIVHWLPNDQVIIEPAGWNQDQGCWQPTETVLQGGPVASLAVEHMLGGTINVVQVNWSQERNGYISNGTARETIVFEKDLQSFQTRFQLEGKRVNSVALQDIEDSSSRNAGSTSAGSFLLGWNQDRTCIISPITYNQSLDGYTHSGPSTQISVTTQFDTSTLPSLIYTIDSQGGVSIFPAGWNQDQGCWQPIIVQGWIQDTQ